MNLESFCVGLVLGYVFGMNTLSIHRGAFLLGFVVGLIAMALTLVYGLHLLDLS